LEMRADDELTLLTRDSVSSYQEDYQAAASQLHRLLSAAAAASATPTEQARIHHAMDALRAYTSAHNDVRHLDVTGQLSRAVAMASGTGPSDLPMASATLDSVLTGGIGTSQQAFDQSVSSASGDIGGLVWAAAVLALLVAAAILIGVQPRIAEYR